VELHEVTQDRVTHIRSSSYLQSTQLTVRDLLFYRDDCCLVSLVPEEYDVWVVAVSVEVSEFLLTYVRFIDDPRQLVQVDKVGSSGNMLVLILELQHNIVLVDDC